MSQNAEEDFRAASFGRTSAEAGRETALVLREGRFSVIALAVPDVEKTTPHLAAVSGARPLAAMVTGIKRNERQTDAEAPAGDMVIVFAVKSGVGQRAINRHVAARAAEQGFPEDAFVARSTRYTGGNQQVGIRMARGGQLGPKALTHWTTAAMTEVVGAGVARLQAGAVNRQANPLVQQTLAIGLHEDLIKQLVKVPAQALREAAQGREMRRLLELQPSEYLGEVGRDHHNTTVVRFEHDAQHEQRKVLGQDVVVTGKAAGVKRQRGSAHVHGKPGNALRGFAQCADMCRRGHGKTLHAPPPQEWFRQAAPPH